MNYNMNIKLGKFDFLQVPRVVWNDKKLSPLAKILYMAMFDRMKVSRSKGWYDENLDVYIYYTIESICEMLGVGTKKAQQIKKELRDRKLIKEARQGLNKPNKIYVQAFEQVYSNNEILDFSNDEIQEFQWNGD